MRTSYLLTAIALAAAIGSGTALAQNAKAQPDDIDQANQVPQVVPNDSLPDQMGYGWQYFSEPHAGNAVVISPSAEYFLNLGNGLRQITGPAGQPLTAQPAHD